MRHVRDAFRAALCVLVLLSWPGTGRAQDPRPGSIGYFGDDIKPVQLEQTIPRPGRCPASLPKPKIRVTGSEDYVGSDGKPYTRYRIEVTNRSVYPDALFAPAPDLPACGINTNSSRTWVDLKDQNGVRLYGFCALARAADLADLWFAMPRGTPPPSCVSVTLTDRRCRLTATSNCAPTREFGPPCVDFESLAVGTTYTVPGTFTDAGATMSVRQLQFANGTWDSGGTARVTNAGQAGGSGKDLAAGNVNIGFQFPVQPNVVFLNFGEFGGNLNIEVNGDFRNFANFDDINAAVIGGARVAVTGGGGNSKGTLTLTGPVHSFAVGGQELWLDHVCFTGQPPVQHEGTWVMPFGVGGTRLDVIKPTGLVDYTDGISGLSMIDAPFGGRLGLRLGAANTLPTAGLYYYRLQYRHELEAAWHDLDETVAVHYVKEAPGTPPVFPTFVLGPHDVGGKNLYRFRPHEAELPSLVPVAAGETVSWPDTGFLGDIYAGYLGTTALGLLPGPYRIRIEIYDSAGALVLPGGGTFRFVVPTGAAPDGTILSDFAPPAAVIAGGFEFKLHVDNRATAARIDEPKIGGTGAGDCGFLSYNPADPPLTPPVRVAFHATHPDNRALFSFSIVRAHTSLALAALSGTEVSATTAGTAGVFGVAYAGDGNGNFSRDFSRGELLGRCREAAFSQNLYVYAKATTGWSHRIASLDSQDVFAFALTPR